MRSQTVTARGLFKKMVMQAREKHTCFPVLGEKWELRLGGRGNRSKGGV